MVIISENRLIVNGKTEEITEWQVWFKTPLGCVPNLDDAIQVCNDLNFDPRLFVKPVPVAIGTLEHEVIDR